MYELIATYGTDMVSIHSADGKFVFVSKNSEPLFGWAQADLIGRSAYEFHHEEDLKRIAEDHATHGVNHDTNLSVKYRLRTKKGSYRWVETRSNTHLTEQGVNDIICITRDVNDQHLAQERALEAEKTLARQMAKMALTDELTDLANRRAAEIRISEEIERAERFKQPLSILLLDLDYFKRINDNYGHGVGDDVLRAVSQALSQTVRPYDLACRWGGEEFLVILSNCNEEQALETGERVGAAVRALNLDPVGRVTVSGGVAEYRHGEHYAAMVERADAGLYAAKEAGRDRIEKIPDRPSSTKLKIV